MNAVVHEHIKKSSIAFLGFILFSLFFVMVFMPIATNVVKYQDARAEAKLKEQQRERYNKILALSFDDVLHYESLKILRQTENGLLLKSVYEPKYDVSAKWTDYPVCYVNGVQIPEQPPGGYYPEYQFWEKDLVKSKKFSVIWEYIGHIPKNATQCKLCSMMKIIPCNCKFGKIEKTQKLCTNKIEVNK